MKLSKILMLGCFGVAFATASLGVSYADDDAPKSQDGCCNFSSDKSVARPQDNRFTNKNGCCSLKKGYVSKKAHVQQSPVVKKDDDDIDVDPDIDI